MHLATIVFAELRNSAEVKAIAVNPKSGIKSKAFFIDSTSHFNLNSLNYSYTHRHNSHSCMDSNRLDIRTYNMNPDFAEPAYSPGTALRRLMLDAVRHPNFFLCFPY
jgi:hypothetical protein